MNIFSVIILHKFLYLQTSYSKSFFIEICLNILDSYKCLDPHKLIFISFDNI